MRLVEKCSCGASIELYWQEPTSEYSYGLKLESKRATDALTTFRKSHAKCSAQNQDRERP